MSVFTDISKSIGWSGSATIPNPDDAKELLVLVRDEQNQAAFEKVLAVFRFAPSPTNEEETNALNTIVEAYKIGTLIFK